MATQSGIFEFDDGTGTTGGPAPIPVVEDGVTFTLSAQGDLQSFTHIRDGDGRFFFEDGAGAFDASFTLAIQNTNGFSKFSGPFTITASSVVGSWQVFHNMSLIGTITTPGQTIQVSAGQSGGSAVKFVNSTGAGASLSIDSINATINCFCAGTLIATPDGPVRVETLRPDDVISTADSGTTRIKWLGLQPIDVRLSHPAKVNPICISAGALGNGLPERDLYLSADHAIAIHGLLINAGALVNGRSIYQVRDMPLDGFTYYHVETEAHELILAEGCPAESFIDYADTGSFVNGDERDGAAPIPEMDLPRISAARLVPQALRTRMTHVGAQTAAA